MTGPEHPHQTCRRDARATLVLGVAVALLVGSAAAASAQDPSTDEPLAEAKLATEVIEPGVVRVTRDSAGHGFVFGAGDEERPIFDAIAAGPDGEVYFVGHQDDQPRSGTDQYPAYLIQLDEPGRPSVPVPSSFLDVAVGPDGTVWAAGEGRYLARFDGTDWEVARPQRGFAELLGVAVGADGTVWGAWRGQAAGPEEPGVVARFDGHEWVDVIAHEWARYGGRTLPFKMAATSDGTLWAGLGPGAMLAGYDGRSWQLAWPLGEDVDHAVHALTIAPDGALWALLETFEEPGMHLARRDADGWTVISAADGAPQAVSHWLRGGWIGDRGRYMEVGPDGIVWLLHREGGVVGFDGDSSRRYLADTFVTDLAVAADGSLWAFGHDERPRKADIYLIRPESAPAAE